MHVISCIEEIENYFDILKKAIDNISRQDIETFTARLKRAQEKNLAVYIMGNGGSAAAASHFCSDYNKSLRRNYTKSRMICLNDNIPSITSYANDIDYDSIFYSQLENILNPEDIVIAVSVSGNSKNIIKAAEYADSIGAETISLTGFDGGLLKKISKYNVNSNIDDMQISEDIHLSILHAVSKILSRTQELI